jgi:diaminopimelate decarboxylase
VEDGEKLGEMEALLHPVVRVQELQLRAELPADAETLDQLADAGAVDRVNLREVQENLPPPFGEKLVHDAAEDLVAEAAVKLALQIGDDDVLRLPDRDVHGPSILAPSRRGRIRTVFRLYAARPRRHNIGRVTTPPSSLADGLRAAREDRTNEPAARLAFARLAAEYGTPLYLYDRGAIESRFDELRRAFTARFRKLRVFYAVKANSNAALIRLLHLRGAGAEVVSLGEILLARKAGVPPSQILFTSSSKGPDEIAYAVRNAILLNVDSMDELEQIPQAAAAAGRTARISFRVNPGVDPETLHQINTGIPESKFGVHLEGGIAFEAYRRAAALPGLQVVGLHAHVGSQIVDPAGHVETARRLLAFARELKEKLGIVLEFLDVGGGLGIPYEDGDAVMSPADLASALAPAWDKGTRALGYEPELWVEPGRWFLGPAGYLLARINSVKRTPVKTFFNVDAGFNTLMRPSMYGAYHRIRVVGRAGPDEMADVAGNVCETGDLLAEGRRLPRSLAGDLVVFLDAGAYGFSMTSEYNGRPLPAEVLVDGDDALVIRRRGTFDDLFRSLVIPERFP